MAETLTADLDGGTMLGRSYLPHDDVEAYRDEDRYADSTRGAVLEAAEETTWSFLGCGG